MSGLLTFRKAIAWNQTITDTWKRLAWWAAHSSLHWSWAEITISVDFCVFSPCPQFFFVWVLQVSFHLVKHASIQLAILKSPLCKYVYMVSCDQSRLYLVCIYAWSLDFLGYAPDPQQPIAGQSNYWRWMNEILWTTNIKPFIRRRCLYLPVNSQSSTSCFFQGVVSQEYKWKGCIFFF